jgi:hypothetical protein
MSDWFFMVGEPMSLDEQRQVHQYLRGLGIDDELPIEVMVDWQSAGRTITNPEWDRRWWDAEQHEMTRLYAKAKAEPGESDLMQSLSRTLQSADAIHGAAAVEAARRGCADPALIRVAAGAASQALHLAELARLAGEGEAHPFSIKAALFAGGHWPLGIVNGCYCVF